MLLRRSRGLLAATLAALAGAALVSAPGQGQARPATADARAFEREDLDGTVGLLEASGTQRRAGASTAVDTSVADGVGTAEASARSEEVELFDGLVTADFVEVAARATARGTRTSGRVRRLRIEGRLVGSPRTKHVYRLGAVGTLAVLSSGRTGVVGLRATLDEPYGGYSAGATAAVAYASARATDGADPAAPPAPPARSRPRRKAAECSNARSDPRCGEARSRRARARAPRRRPAPRLEALRTSRGYAFPVYRGYSYGDDWGAPRRYTGRHEGTDVFAPAGTPVLAVTERHPHAGGHAHRCPATACGCATSAGTPSSTRTSRPSPRARATARASAPARSWGSWARRATPSAPPPTCTSRCIPRAAGPSTPTPSCAPGRSAATCPPRRGSPATAGIPGARPGVLVVVEDFLDG